MSAREGVVRTSRLGEAQHLHCRCHIDRVVGTDKVILGWLTGPVKCCIRHCCETCRAVRRENFGWRMIHPRQSWSPRAIETRCPHPPATRTRASPPLEPRPVARQAFFRERAVLPRDGDDVTVTAVAAAAFAGGWFCALLAIITMACWSESSIAGGRVEGGSRLPSGVSAWLLRVFTDP